MPQPPELGDLLRRSLASDAPAETRKAFATAWQGWVEAILIRHADEPGLITIMR